MTPPFRVCTALNTIYCILCILTWAQSPAPIEGALHLPLTLTARDPIASVGTCTHMHIPTHIHVISKNKIINVWLRKETKGNVEISKGCIARHMCSTSMPCFSMPSFITDFPFQLPAGAGPVWKSGWRLQFGVPSWPPVLSPPTTHTLIVNIRLPLSLKCRLLLHQYHVHLECYSNLYVCQVSHAKYCLLPIKQKPLRFSDLFPVVFRLKRFSRWPLITSGYKQRALLPSDGLGTGRSSLVDCVGDAFLQSLFLKHCYSLGYHIILIIHWLTFFQQ